MKGIHQVPTGLFGIILGALVTLGPTTLPSAADTPADAAAAGSKNPAETVGDFALLDQNGRFQRLYRQSNKQAVVLMIAGTGCPIVRQNLAKLKQLRQAFPTVRFWLLNANPQDDLASIVAEAREFNVDLPILKDDTQMVAHSLGVKRTAEVIAIGTKDWNVFYRGALDDQMVQGAVKAKVSEPYVANALKAFLKGKEVAVARTEAAGCLVHYDWALDVPNDQLSYAEHVAPILERKCVSCHSQGNIGPFAMSSYAKVRGFSDQIHEEVMTQRMPPWSADRHFGAFQSDFSLSPAEKQTLLRWLEAGKPRGSGEDPLAELAARPHPESDGWPAGKPDYVVTPSERMTIPATGVVDYITNIVDCPIPSDAWLRGAVIRPDNKKVLHHVIVYLEYPQGHRNSDRWEEKWLVGWAPGTPAQLYPPGTGKFLPKGCKLRFQLHYTPYGKETTDLTELGLYLHQERPTVEIRMSGVANGDFVIPPNQPEARTLAIQEFPRDTLIYELAPHMHKRGSWFRYEALYPDGRFETLLSVPRYNFNWQSTYRFAEPKLIPAGTRILCTGAFDNSKLNPDNPDPEKTVRWGDQSFDEMFIGFMTISDPLPKPGEHAQAAGVVGTPGAPLLSSQ